MSSYHTVEQGEHLSLIAEKYGFMDYQTIWGRDENADLRQKRQNPNTLFPGDQVFIPDKQLKKNSVDTGQLHRFQIKKSKLTLRLALEYADGSPLADVECELKVDGQAKPVTTDDDGMIELEIPGSAREASVAFKEAGLPFGLEIPLKIGHLDPVDEQTGQVARLNNLGYLAGPLDPVDEKKFASAVEEFQCDTGLQVDGTCGPETQAKLVEVHGC